MSGRKEIDSPADVASLGRGMDKDVAKALRDLLADGDWRCRTTGSRHVLVRHAEHGDLSLTLSLTPKNPNTSLRNLKRLAAEARKRVQP